jgi:hypothetical protein
MTKPILALLACVLFFLTAGVRNNNAGEPKEKPARPLEIYFIDIGRWVGNATLIVAPSGESMMLDAGPSFAVNKIVDVLKKAGVEKIDYLVNTHYHSDHCSATLELSRQIPIVHFVDHGESVEFGKSDDWWKERRGPWFKPGMGEKYDELYMSYVKARSAGRHTVVRPGDTIPIKGIEARVVCAGGKILSKPLPGAGADNPAGKDVDKRRDDDAEDAQSIGVLLQHGPFRFIFLGDLTWNMEHSLFYPKNLVGTVDAYLVTHHAQSLPKSMGDYYHGLSACPKSETHGLSPRVAILSLGALGHKAGTSEAMENVRSVPGLQDVWQTQYIEQGGEKDHNSPKDFCANIGGKNEPTRYLKLSANADGSFTMINSRNGFTKKYERRAK